MTPYKARCPGCGEPNQVASAHCASCGCFVHPGKLDISVPDDKKLTIKVPTEPPTIIIHGKNGGIHIQPDGTSQIFGDYDPDETAKVFWEAVCKIHPKLPALNCKLVYDTDSTGDAVNWRVTDSQGTVIGTLGENEAYEVYMALYDPYDGAN